MPPAGREDRLPVNCQGTETMTSEPKTNMCYPTETINQFLISQSPLGWLRGSVPWPPGW